MKTFSYIVVLCALTTMPACTSKHSSQAKTSPAQVEAKKEGSFPVVHLTPEAEKRLGISTVHPTSNSGRHHLPSSAILYDVDGSVWIYVRVAPLSYQRVAIFPIKVGRQLTQIGTALASEMEIVTAGAAELYGTETGGGK